MSEALNIIAAIVLAMFVFMLWPAAKHWQQHGPKAQAGDWQAVLLPIAAVIGLVFVLILIVR